MSDERPLFDHLVLGSPDVPHTRQFLQSHGIQTVFGGRHERFGTWNALVKVGDRSYLEIVGPEPGATVREQPPMGVGELSEPRLVGWAIECDNVDTQQQRLVSAGLAYSPVRELQRAGDSGDIVRWRRSHRERGETDAPFPFLISWCDGAHPVADGEQAAWVDSVTVITADPAGYAADLAELGIVCNVRVAAPGERPGLSLALRGPGGVVVLQ